MFWNVLIEAEAPDSSTWLQPGDGRLIAFSRVLESAYRGAASGDARHWSARLAVAQEGAVRTAEHAAVAAGRYVRDAASQVGLPEWPFTQTSVIPELLGPQDAAAVLGVTRQRLHELRASGRFPVPAAELTSGPVWRRPAVDDFLSRWARFPGPRPSRTVPYIAADGAVHHFTAAASERTGTVWIPVALASTEPALAWVIDLQLPSSPWDGTTGPAVFRVPRPDWTARVNQDGRPHSPASA